jgi:acid phosphatase
MAPFITALGVLENDKGPLPTTHVVADRMWRTSSILPMGARVTLERMSCLAGSGESYVRVNINDRIMPLPFCKSGPGGSCPVGRFVDYVYQRRAEVGAFAEVCGLQGDVGSITFLHQN